MDLTIEQSCPGCGASIELYEDDRMIRCPFCEVHNYMLERGARRFVLPWSLPANIDEEDLLFVPYLRFKGAIFYTSGDRVKHKLVDTTRLGLVSTRFPASLRLRPQAMKVKPIVAGMAGRFLGQTVKTETVFSHAVRISTLFAKKKDRRVYHRAFIGESLSRIYQPCYIHEEQLFDAVDNALLGESSSLERDQNNSFASKASWEPRFIPTICRECGDLLEGERDSLVLYCRNCETLWQEQAGRFIKLKWNVVESGNRKAKYLPFWKIAFCTTGESLKTFGEFLRLTNQPVIVRREFDDIPLAFWIPAFKINPKVFLQLAAKLTVVQLRIPEGKKGRLGNIYPVTLHWKEAVQAIKSVLAAASLHKKRVFPLLSEMNIASANPSLKYLPFNVNSHELVQEHTLVTVNSAALRYGRRL